MLKIILNNSSMVPIYEQLAAQIQHQILEGALKTDTVLPSVRALSAQLRISALTVKKAYDWLEAEGFVVTVHGKGTYVAAAGRLLAEERRRQSIEESFAAVIDRAKAFGYTADEIREVVSILLESAEEQEGRTNDRDQ